MEFNQGGGENNYGSWRLFGFWSLDFGAFIVWGACPIGECVRPDYNAVMNTREMTEKLQDWQKLATKTAKNVGEATDDYVRENTWSTIAFAAVIGCIFGYLLASRRD